MITQYFTHDQQNKFVVELTYITKNDYGLINTSSDYVIDDFIVLKIYAYAVYQNHFIMGLIVEIHVINKTFISALKWGTLTVVTRMYFLIDSVRSSYELKL